MDHRGRLLVMLVSDFLEAWNGDVANDVRKLSSRLDLDMPEGWEESELVRLFHFTPPEKSLDLADNGTEHIDEVHRSKKHLYADEGEFDETACAKKLKVDGEKKDLEFLKLRAVDQKGREVMFKIKSSTTMEKLKKGYGEQMGSQNVANFRFLFDGQIIRDKDTPASLDLENDDVIDVYEEQEGGYFG